MIRHLLLFLATSACVSADRIVPPPSLFRDPAFIKDFVGSYGILSDVEPRVSAEEQTMLGSVRELFEASKFKEAEATIQQFIRETENPTDRKKEPAEISPAMIFVLGNLYFQADRTEEARKQFLEAIKRFPRFRRAHTNLGYLYISKNQTDLALPMFQKAVELGESSSRVYGLIGYCHLIRKNPLAAENAYRQAYLLDPNSRDWKLGLAQSLMGQEKFPEAASMIGTLIEENPNDKQLWLQQTNAYLAMEKKEAAAVNLEILRIKNLADENNLNLLGNLYMDRSQPQLALNAYLAAIDKAPSLDVARALKSARILNDYGFPEKAEDFILKVRAKLGAKIPDATLTSLMLTEVRIAQTQKQNERVGTLLAKLTEIQPTNGEVLLELARHHDLQARDETDEVKRASLIQEARTSYQLAIRNQEVAYPANLGLGQMYVRERRYVEAVPLLENALGLKKSESLEQYTGRVRRAADRQKQKEEAKES
ncbi:MAG: tetratricopeptide repeat protein [Akkermansiaceae bacterium]